jgi:hypothetical protein
LNSLETLFKITIHLMPSPILQLIIKIISQEQV